MCAIFEHVFVAALKAGEFGSNPVPDTRDALGAVENRGSGKLGTPWERIHWAYSSS